MERLLFFVYLNNDKFVTKCKYTYRNIGWLPLPALGRGGKNLAVFKLF
jgi:hypothetical protein